MEEGKLVNKDIKPVLTFREHVNSVESAQFNPKNSNQFVSVSHDSTAKIWDLEKHVATSTITGLE